MSNEIDVDKTLVIFRRYPKRKGGAVIALFPEIDEGRGFCNSYIRVGQHGVADYTGVVDSTRPCTLTVGGLPFDDDARSLYDELTRIGYNLKVRRRWNRRTVHLKETKSTGVRK